jgi:hypothetical protein
MNIKNTGNFGNYLIHGIEEISLPEAISLWPSAPGWQILGLIVLAWLLRQAVRWIRHWWQNRYRREALRQIDQMQRQAPQRDVVVQLPFYLKATALQAYPREQVASLSGRDWLVFLDAHYTGPSFSSPIGEKLLSISYLPEEQWQLDDATVSKLIQMSRQWITLHRQSVDV